MDDAALIATRGLEKRYATQSGEEIVALSNVSFDVRDGEFVTVVGPSGCGKSTLLRILAGILRKSGGAASLAGHNVDGPSRDVGVVFQAPVLLAWRTVLQNVLLPIHIQKRTDRDYDARAHALLRTMGLEGFENRYPGELSGGMQQRVGIARALIHDPAVLLMDEPFGALDAMTRESMNLELLRVWTEARKTVMLVTHSIAEAIFLADRVIVMSPRPGRITEIVTVDLPRPRELPMMTTPHFGAYVAAIRRHFQSLGSLDT